jgi:hypothetical protein
MKIPDEAYCCLQSRGDGRRAKPRPNVIGTVGTKHDDTTTRPMARGGFPTGALFPVACDKVKKHPSTGIPEEKRKAKR